MLLAEIHGKGRRDIEDVEDLLTSAVFGHLRLIDPPVFWLNFLQRARTAHTPSRSFTEILSGLGVQVSRFSKVRVSFWPRLQGSSEPDLLVELSGVGIPTITFVIEVKLHAGKSSTGEGDQLAKYLDKLAHLECPLAHSTIENRFLVYLTKNFVGADLEESVKRAKTSNAESRIFGIEWNDIAEIASDQRQHHRLLDEVADFLKLRGFERFHGFMDCWRAPEATGTFYQHRIFEKIKLNDFTIDGRFYGT